MLFARSNGARRTSDQRHRGPVQSRLRLWLSGNDRMSGVLRKYGGFDLPAEIAIDTRIGDEEVAGHVLRVGPLSIRHRIDCTPTPSWRSPALCGVRSLRGYRGLRRPARYSAVARASVEARHQRCHDD